MPSSARPVERYRASGVPRVRGRPRTAAGRPAAPTSTSSPEPAPTATGRCSVRTSRRWRARAAIRSTASPARTTIAGRSSRFPRRGRTITGDAWLGWYTTKDGGLSGRRGCCPAIRRTARRWALASPLKGYAAGADPVIRPGTNGLFYYGGLVFNRDRRRRAAPSSSRASSTTTIRKVSPATRSPTSGTSIVHRLGAGASRGPPRASGTRHGRDRAVSASAKRARARSASAANRRVQRAPAPSKGVLTQLVDKPWIAVDVPRAGAQTCTIGGPGTDVPLQTFPGGPSTWPTRVFDGARRSSAAGSCSAARSTAERPGAHRA